MSAFDKGKVTMTRRGGHVLCIAGSALFSACRPASAPSQAYIDAAESSRRASAAIKAQDNGSQANQSTVQSKMNDDESDSASEKVQ